MSIVPGARRRLRSRGIRAALVLIATAGVLATTAFQPLAASAQTLSAAPHPAKPAHLSARPKTHPKPWSAAAAKARLRHYPVINLAQARQQAIAQAATKEKTADYQVSPAVLAFLRTGLGLRLEPSTTFTGVKSGGTLRVVLSAPEVNFGLPAGVAQPRFSGTTMIINPATGAVSLASSSADGALHVDIPNAKAAAIHTGDDLTSDVTLRVPVLGQSAALSGQVSYRGSGAAGIALSGRLPHGVNLGTGIAELGSGATVSLSSAGGLRVLGSATLGRPGHQLDVRLTGTDTGKSGWTYRVTGGDGGALTPLPGLELSSGLSGSLTTGRGGTHFTVHGQTARPWSPLPGVSVAGAVEFSNSIPNERAVPAPGITGSTPWATVDGTVTLTTGQAGTVAAPGTVAVNLASGKGILTGGGISPATLAPATSGAAAHDGLVLDQAGFRGALTVTDRSVAGSVRGTGRVTVSGAGHAVTTDSALSLSRSGRLVVSLPKPALALASTPLQRASSDRGSVSSARSVSKATSANSTTSTSYTLSNSVYSFLTGTLHIPLGSATLSGSLSGQTLTVGVSAPTALPSSLPGWLPNPSYVSAQISVDESTGTLTLTAGTGTNSGLGGTLTVTIANASSSSLTDGTDVTGSLALTGVPFAGGSTASLTFTLGYTGSALSASLAGSTTSAATFANGVVTIPAGATLTLATGTGLSLSGTANINVGSTSTQITVNGTLTDLKNWSLTVGDANAPAWQPVAGLTVTPDLSGTISDTAGTVGFSLASAGSGPVAQWVSPDSSSTVSICGFELSNQSPSGTTVACGTQQAAQATCTTSEVSSGDLWIGIVGAYSYAPANLQLNASGCLDLTARSVTIATAATGSLTGEFPSGLPFSVTQAGLVATVTTAGKFSLTGTASVVVTGGGVSGDPKFTAGLSLSNAGIVGGVQVPLGELGLSGTGTSGVLYVSTAAMNNFDPATLGLSGTVIPVLPTGLTVSFSYAIPANVISALQNLIPSFPSAAVTATASLGPSGFAIDAGVVLGTGVTTGGFQLTPSGSNLALYLDRLDLGLSVGTNTEVSVSGTGYVKLPALAPGSVASAYSVTLSAEFNVDEGSLTLGFNLGNVQNALGINGFNVQDFGGSIGLLPDDPTLQLYADNIVLPGNWAQTIGMVQGTRISFNANISVTQPALMISLQPPASAPGQPVLEPLSVDPNLSPATVQSFQVNRALFELAPFGGTDPGTGAALNAGVEVIFDATIANVGVHVDATVNLTALSVSANVSVGSYWIGPVQVQNAYVYLNLSPTSGKFGVSGGVASNGFSFSATFTFAVNTSSLGAGASLTIRGGLPNWLEAYGSLTGGVSASGSSVSINAYGYGYLTAGSGTLGPVNFSVSLPGSLSWQDFVDSITSIAQFFVNAATSISQVWSILQSLGYGTWDIFNALGSIGQYGSQILNSLASAFGFSTTYYDIWTWTSSAEELVLDVSGGSQSPNASVDTWYWNKGYNQDWEFVQSPWSGWYEIVNRGSGQCLSVYGNSTSWGQPLVQYPCFGGYDQLWYMGSINLATTYVITSALDSQVVDVQGAYPWAGGTVDQYPYNGGNNQQFWLTNSAN